ncbi:MAG TPA: DnaJ domain-containing protein, partial [Usitatibacter sp.]|nr:DnaJ domain-containing protein [Usitatibacter sp.]
MAKQTLYDILGVPPDAMPIDVALAYDKRLQELRAAPVQDTGALTLLRQAHEVLGDPKRRAAYDASLVSASEKAAAKEQAAAPDLVLEPDEDEAPRRRIPPVGIAVGIVALLVI